MHKPGKHKAVSGNCGFTFIELILTIVVIGILISVAVQQISPVMDTFNEEETRAEMDRIAYAVIGDGDINKNVGNYFGYVGDIGAMPPNLDALLANPGSYGTWNGPYLNSDFEQDPDDFKKDAWQADYIYSGGVSIISSGSGDNIVRHLANSVEDILYNTATGNIFDLDGTPPGNVYDDSIAIFLTVPDGAGATAVKSSGVDAGGYFSFDSIPTGNHNIDVIYFPAGDTVRRSILVYPKTNVYNEIYLASNYWPASAGSQYITKAPGSDSLKSDCHGFYFWIENNTDDPITVDSVTLTWSAPEAYYRYIRWDGAIAFNRNNPKVASGETVALDSPQTINPGESLAVEFDSFRTNPTGGSNVNMDDTDFTVLFSDGSVLTVSTGDCP